MADDLSKRRRAENEVTLQEHNQQRAALATQVLPSGQDDYPITVVCECSNEDCRRPVHIPMSEYLKACRHPLRFVLSPGHDQPDIEQVAAETDDYIVVEKYELPPSAEESRLQET